MQDIGTDYFVAGVDEAGRGPLAGPVIAAAVILNPHRPIDGLTDSKQLTEKKRDNLFEEIRQHALAFAFARATVAEIDDMNILQATFLAMQRAVAKLKIAPHLVLVDGNRCPKWSHHSKAIVRGDQSEPAISAASIVAKVVRDRIMMMLDKKYPDYGFAKHKGYPTASHIHALNSHGPSRVHRQSFAPVAKAKK